MATFSFTDNIIKRLNEDLFTRSSSNFDAGIEKSALVKAWGQGFNISDILTRIFGTAAGNYKPEDIKEKSMSVLQELDNDNYLNQVLFSPVRTVPVQLPYILMMDKNQQSDALGQATQVESSNYTWNYKPLFEASLLEASLHRLGKGYYQAMDSSHRVFFMRRGHLATVEPSKTVASFIQNVGSTMGHGSIHRYVLDSLDLISNQAEQEIISNLNALDKEFVSSLLDRRIPLPLQNAAALGILDAANLKLQTSSKSMIPTSGSLAELVFNNKIPLIQSNAKIHPDGYSVSINPGLTTDIKNKIRATIQLVSNIYKEDNSQQFFINSYELGKKNPHSTYRKVYKMNLTVFNWIVNDLNTKVFKSSARDSSIYFRNPSPKEIKDAVGGASKKDTMPFVAIKAIANQAGFPVQFRCFATECSKSKDATYNSINGVTKVCVITPGFNSYITNKAKEETGGADLGAYIKELSLITPSESSAHMSFTEGAKVMWSAIEQCYAGDGKFESKTLFKHVPELLSTAEIHGIDILTSLKDLSSSQPHYVSNIPVKSKNYEISKVATHAAYLLVNPMGQDRGGIPSPTVDDSALRIQTEFISSNDFMSLSQIRDFFLAKIEDVQSLNDLQELSNLFSNVLKNLSRGFWTAKGNFGLSTYLREGRALGLFNILKSDNFSSDDSTMKLGDIGGRLNLASLGLLQFKDPDTGQLQVKDTRDNRLFTNAQQNAIEDALTSVVTFIGAE